MSRQIVVRHIEAIKESFMKIEKELDLLLLAYDSKTPDEEIDKRILSYRYAFRNGTPAVQKAVLQELEDEGHNQERIALLLEVNQSSVSRYMINVGLREKKKDA